MTQQVTEPTKPGGPPPAAGVVLEHAAPLPGLAGWLFRHVPALDSLRHYSGRALTADVMAGLTVATVAVPQSMAYAILAGLPPQYGLYTAIVMTAVGALLDSSRQLINGPTNAISIALLSALAVLPEEERLPAAVLLAFLVGLVQLGIALLRLGDLTRYVSHAVIVGFTVGAGTLLVLDQMKNLLGLKAEGRPDDHFLKRFWLSLTEGGGVHWPTFLIGAGTIAVVLAVRGLNGLLRERGARFPIPQHLVAVIFMATLVWGFELDARHGVKIVGTIPPELPHFQAPDLKWDQVRLLSGNAFAIAMLGLLEAVAMAKAIAARTGQKLDINQQCLSEGAANMAGSFFQCFPGSGSLTRSAVNQQAGAVSQWSGVFAAVAVAATVLLFAPLARYIPRASLAGLLMLAAFRMVDFKQLAFHLRATRFDAGVVLATALAAVFISVEFCILIGVFLSFVLYVPRAARVRLAQLTLTPDQHVRERQPGDAACDRLLFYNLEGELFFGTEPELDSHFAAIEQAAAQGEVRVVVLVLKRARNPDAGFLRLLKDFHRRLRRRNVTLLLSGVQPDLSRALGGSGLDARIGTARIFCDSPPNGSSTLDAFVHAYRLLGEGVCATCPRKQKRPWPDEPIDYVI
jgi:SulP family sulfate permease